ncbi:hypothetical protein QF037_000491 [Streptomyces canus]|nr:hypothetical protein [Streptomyces canus]
MPSNRRLMSKIGKERRAAGSAPDHALDFLPLVNEGDSYGSRRGVFCFTADCPVREDSR